MTLRQQGVPARFGARIQRERELRGWSMRELAGKCGMSPSTIMRAERGYDAALSSAIAIAAVLGVGLDWLLAEMECDWCDGTPPAGFICPECGRGGKDSSNEKGERDER